MTPCTLQKIGELYVLLNYGPQPLTRREVAAYQKSKAELDKLCRGDKLASPWTSVDTDMPDDDAVVLVAIEDGDEPVWMGYHADGQWYCIDAVEMQSTVTHWMHLPEHPEDMAKAVTV